MTPELVAKALATGAAVSLVAFFFLMGASYLTSDSNYDVSQALFRVGIAFGGLALLSCLAIVIPTIWAGGSLCP